MNAFRCRPNGRTWLFKTSKVYQKNYLVPRAGLEPASLTASDFKSDVVTNFTTEAQHI